MRSTQSSSENQAGATRLWEAVLVLAFLGLCGFDILHHAMWRDEMQPWLFARDSATVPQLLTNMHYETHPRLWYLLLFGIARLTTNPMAMQAANFLIIGAAISLFVRFCPLPLCLKTPIVFGYFFVFEWGTKSRNYALGVLFCFAFCALFPRRRQGWLGLAAILFLAIQSNISAAMISLALAGLLILEVLTDPAARRQIRARKLDVALSALLVFGGTLLALWTAIPKPDIDPAENFFKSGVTVGNKIMGAFGAAFDGFVPFVGGSIEHFFAAALALHAASGLILLLLTATFFRRSRLILVTYTSGAGLLLLFAFIKVQNHWWHNGHFFLWFLVCIWLARSLSDSTESPEPKPFNLSFLQRVFIGALLPLQIFDSALISIKGFNYPFSCSKSVALYLDRNHLRNLPMMGYPDYLAMPVSGYTGLPIYYPDSHRWGTFLIEDNKRQAGWTAAEVMRAVNEFAAQGNRDFLVLLPAPLMLMNGNRTYEAKHVGNLYEEASFQPAIQTDEIYWLYRYSSSLIRRPAS